MSKFLLILGLLLISSMSYADDIWIFSADWCAPCSDLKNFLKTYHKTIEDQGHRISIINIDHNKKLASEHKIHLVPTTIVFDNNKNEKDRMSGFSEITWPLWIKSTTR